jgi:hypothetical protein
MSSCGGSGKKSAGTVGAGAYVAQVCSSLGTWLHDLDSRAEAFNAQMGAQTSRGQGTRNLESLVGQTITDTGGVIQALREAGVPDVEKGQAIAAAMIGAFKDAEGSLKQAQSRVRGLATSNAEEFEANAQQIARSVQGAPIALTAAMAALRSPELQKAAAQSTVCADAGAHTKP